MNTTKTLSENSTNMSTNRFESYVIKYRTDCENVSDRLSYDTICLLAEAGEVADEVKKLQRDGPNKDSDEKILLECGDTLHFIVRILEDIGYSLYDCMEANMEKLDSRAQYGKGNRGLRS
jgi:NTP pyrophosphatase (non-canonical NTP hydrolase)